MRKFYCIIICLFLLFYSCRQGNQINVDKNNIPVETATLKKTISDYNKFALYLYSRLPSKPVNTLVSPLSVALALNVIYELSDKQTKEEMKNDLYLNEDKNILKTDFSYINYWLGKNKLQNVDYTSNESVWLDTRFEIEKAILKEVKKYYGNILFNLNFQNDLAKSKLNLIKWMQQFKSDKDTSLIADEMVSKYTKMFVLTIAHLNAIWEEGFDTTKIEKGVFYPDKKEVKYLTKVDSFYCHDNPVMQIIEIPLKNNIFSFLLFLPRHAEDFDYVESVINHENYYKTQRAPLREKINLKIPIFKIENKLKFKSVINKFGVPSLFSDSACFSGVKGDDTLIFDEVYQQSFISIDEKGNKKPVVNSENIHKKNIKTFNVNHPFIFIIRENTYNTIIFIGKVFDPIQK